jgi:hypothetical protein
MKNCNERTYTGNTRTSVGYNSLLFIYMYMYSVWLQTRRPGHRGSIPGRGERIFPLASMSRPALGPTQLPVQWVPGVLSPGLERGRGVALTTHPHLVPRSISRSYMSSAPKSLHGLLLGQHFSLVYVKYIFLFTFFSCYSTKMILITALMRGKVSQSFTFELK